MLRNILLAVVFCCALLLLGCGESDSFVRSLPAKSVDLSRYLGTWYEIARIPSWFEGDLNYVTATYSLKKDGQIDVHNEGLTKSQGEKKVAIGTAWLPDTSQTGRLKVSFFWLVAADYVVFDLDPDYQYALVGSSRDFLWILSRKPQMDETLYQQLLAKATSAGYDVTRLERVIQ